jgi:hypothetical protein
MTNMKSYWVSASALIEARASRVYAILADYRHGHPQILPEKYFRSMDIEEGGIGAGTTLLLEMRALGRTRFMRLMVSEPAPGRLLVERDVETGAATTFLVEAGGPFTRVTITTELKSRGGPLGWLERWFTSALLRRVYSRELKLLAEYCFREDEIPSVGPRMAPAIGAAP